MSPSASDLETLLREELGTLQILADLLDDEHEALLSNNAESLENTTGRKNSAIEAHQAQQQKRLSWMASVGLGADTPLATVVDQASGENSSALSELQAALEALAAECQQRNRRNGGLIVRLQNRTRDALDVLRREESSNIYSVSGAPDQRGDGRSLGKA